MSELVFEDLEFEEKDGKVIVKFLDHFYFEAEKEAFKGLKPKGKKLFFEGLEKDARNRFNAILDSGFQHLKSGITGKPAVYVNRYFGLPLIGSGAFGIVDRNSSMLEIKPITGCNMNCIFCSVDEGLATKKVAELVIDEKYLAEEAKKVIESKDCDVHITINAHGEPTTYRPMPELIADLAKIKNVKTISLITNGTLIDEKYVDRVVAAGMTRLNVSLNAISEKASKILEGHGKYDVNHVKRVCEYAAKKVEVVLAPVFVPGYNEDELELIIKFAKEIGAKVGIQNFLHYPRGRNPAKSMPWDDFYSMLRKLEHELDFKLILDEEDFGIVKTRPLPKPFKEGQVIEAVMKCPGRYPNEILTAARDRCVTLIDHKKFIPERKIKIKITRDKHNIFLAS